jgi:hypothetical protein
MPHPHEVTGMHLTRLGFPQADVNNDAGGAQSLVAGPEDMRIWILQC